MSRALMLVASAGLVLSAQAQSNYRWVDLPGLFASGVQQPRVTSITLADPDVGGPLGVVPIVVGNVSSASGGSAQWVLRWDGTSWVALTPVPSGFTVNTFATSLQATNLGDRLRLHGAIFAGNASILSYGGSSWTGINTGDAQFVNPAANSPLGLIYSNALGALKVFDGIGVIGTIPSPNWFLLGGAPTGGTRGTVSIFGQIYAYGGIGSNGIVSTPGVFFYSGVGADPWISIGNGSVGNNIGEPTSLESLNGDLYLGTKADFSTTSVGTLAVRRNSAPNTWQFLASFTLNNNQFSSSGIRALRTIVAGGVPYLIIAGSFDTVVPLGGPSITGCAGVIAYNGTTFSKLASGFGGNVEAMVPTADLKALYLAGATNDASSSPLVRRWEPVPCYANCDGSTASPVLSAGDFVCFLNKFRAGDSYANCDGSTGNPTLTAADFVCYLSRFRAGCP